MNKLKVIIISVILTVSFSAIAYDNTNIRDAKTCKDLLNSLLSGESLYKMSPVFNSSSGNVLNLGGLNIPPAGRYDYVEIIPEQLKSKSFRENLLKTEGRLFFKSKNSVSDAQKFFETWVEKPKVIFAIPYDKKSIKNVYGNKLDDKSINNISSHMDRIHSSLNDLEIAQAPNVNFEINRQYIFDELSNDKSDTIILVGHNSKGILKLPSGENLDISKLQKSAKDKGKNLLIISCNSFDYVDASFEGLVSIERLNYESIVEGLKLAEKNRCKYTECTMFMGDYMYFLDQGISANIETSKKIKVKIIITASTVGGGTGIATISFIVTYNNEA